MAKLKTSLKREQSLQLIEPVQVRAFKQLKPFRSEEYLRNSDSVIAALVECLRQGDGEGFKEVLAAHLLVINKAQFARRAGLSQRTLFRMLSSKGNPTLDKVAKLFQALSKAG